MLIILTIAIVTYVGMIFFTKYRTPIAVLGSAILLIYGTITDFFPANLAFENFPQEIIILIIVLGLFTKVFERSGFFNYVGYQFIHISKGRKVFIIGFIPIVMYLTSLFMNNLTVILLFTFICLNIALEFDLPVTPLLVSAIIASNIGGAPLPWADTPAVILTLYTDFTLLDFLTKLFVPCAIYTILLAKYCIAWFNYLNTKNPPMKSRIPPTKEAIHKFISTEPESLSSTIIHHIIKPKPPKQLPHHSKQLNPLSIKKLNSKEEQRVEEEPPPSPTKIHYIIKPKPHEKLPQDLRDSRGFGNISESCDRFHSSNSSLNWKEIRFPLILFILFIIFVCIGPFINLSIAFISMIFGSILLIINKHNPEDTINAIPILDSLIFIVALFLIGGTLEYSGVLNIAVNYVLTFTGSNPSCILICIMMTSFLIATFLSAGPAAATLLPICTQLSPMVGNRLVYAALALGILAGSSMLPWSATGGPVLLGEVSRFIRCRDLSGQDKRKVIEIFNLKEYLKFSVPFSLTMVVLNCLFLIIYLQVLS